MTPSTTMSAVTPTATPPVEITVFNEAVREFRRLLKYRRAIRHSSFEGQRMLAASSRNNVRTRPGPPVRLTGCPPVTSPPAAWLEK
jgi:hypothetical protein